MIDKIIRTTLVLSLFLLYWSSDLLEKDVKLIKRELRSLHEDVLELVRISNQQKNRPHSASVYVTPEARVLKDCGDPLFPNLLSEDLYIKEVMPSLLKENFVPKGVVRTAQVGRPDNLSPFNGFVNIVRFYELCVPTLAVEHVGKYEEFAPSLALKVEEHYVQDGSGDKEFHIYLRPDVFWEPIDPTLFPKNVTLADVFLKPHPVTAHDVKFYYDVVMNPYVAEMRAVAMRSYFEDIISVRVENDLKLVVRWRAHTIHNEQGEEEKKVLYSALANTLALQPLPCFVYQYFSNGEKIIQEDSDPDTYRQDSVWAQNFASHWAYNYIVSCGAFRFGGMDDEKITLVRNPNYYNPFAALVEKRYVYMKDSTDAIFQDFKAGKVDMTYFPPNHVENLASFMKTAAYKEQVARGEAILEKNSSDRSYSYIGWNCRSIFFKNRAVRQAMNMLVDRERIIEQCLDGRGLSISGPFALCSPSYNRDVEGWQYSPEEASRKLEESGWVDTDGDGIREKVIEGVVVPFRFQLCYYVKSVTARTIAEYIATVCKEVGIECCLLGLDIADYSQALEEKNFDAILSGWCLGTPPEDPRSLWHSEGALEKGSANAVGFCNEEADSIIEQLSYEYDPDKRQKLYHRFHEIIHEEAPYAFLYTRQYSLVHKEYIKNIFIPTEHPDLIPGAQDETVNLSMMWVDRREEQCSAIS